MVSNVTANEPELRVPDSELDFEDELFYRWRGAPFTGVGYEEIPGGGLSEVTYRYGVQEGPARDWYPSGALKGESNFQENVQHGTSIEYAEDGTAITEASYEYGILVERKEQDEDGHLVTTFVLPPDSETFALLERYRREKGWPGSGLFNPLIGLCRRRHRRRDGSRFRSRYVPGKCPEHPEQRPE